MLRIRIIMSNDSIKYLQKLELLLKKTSKPTTQEFLGENIYAEQQKAFERITNQRELSSTYLAKRICGGLEARKSLSIKVCSLGCGDGHLDMEYITKVLTKHSELNIELLAVDINESSCDKATELFTAVVLEHGKRFKFSVICCDILEIPTKEHGSFDIVTIVHTLYFVPALKDVLMKCYELKKSNGETIIVTAAKNPINELFSCFWFHENKRNVNFANDVSENLTQLSISYEVEEIACDLDFTECFKNGFQDHKNVWILDFITHSTLSKYSPSVQDTCIQYISSIAQGKPDRYIVERNAQIIILTGCH